MKDLQFITRGNAISEEDIDEFERKFAIKLPGDYRRFLLETNGGEQPKFKCFRIENGDEWALKGFYSIKGTGYSSLEVAAARMKPLLPKGAIQIGWDDLGNGICLFVSGPRKGEVCFWDHEQEHSGLDGPDQVIFIARSFEQFIDSLSPKAERPLDEIEWMGKFGKTSDLLGFLGKGNGLEEGNKYRRTILMEAAMNGNLEMMEAAIAHGANMTGVIHYAAANSKTEAIDLLLRHGIDINEKDNQGRTPLARAWNKDFINLLKARGATM